MTFAATWMDRGIVIQIKVSQKKKDNMLSKKKKKIQMNLSTKQKQTHRNREKNLWLPKRKGGGRIF